MCKALAESVLNVPCGCVPPCRLGARLKMKMSSSFGWFVEVVEGRTRVLLSFDGGGMRKLPYFVMCLHGQTFCQCGCCFSPFCVQQLLRFSILTWPRISKFLSRIVRTIHGHVLREWTRCVFLKLFVFSVPTMFSGILGSFVENSTVVYFPLLVCTQTQLEVCVVERIVARSVSSPEFFLFSASVCVAPFFSNPCLQGWATICSFVYMGARNSCLRA